jgi:hypothetical protein
MSNYARLVNFGAAAAKTPQNDPITYCALSGLESGFNHTLAGGLLAPDTTQCQRYMSQYCSNKWDGVCELVYNDTSMVPNMVAPVSNVYRFMTKGQILLYNTAAEKYLVKMSENCIKVLEPFDPTVPSSPLVSRWMPRDSSCGTQNCLRGNCCIPVYDVDAKSIDSDIVMTKLLNNAWVGMDILTNIYRNRLVNNTIMELENTKIGRYFASPNFQQYYSATRYK